MPVRCMASTHAISCDRRLRVHTQTAYVAARRRMVVSANFTTTPVALTGPPAVCVGSCVSVCVCVCVCVASVSVAAYS